MRVKGPWNGEKVTIMTVLSESDGFGRMENNVRK